MNNADVSLADPILSDLPEPDAAKGRKRELLPSRLHTVIDFLRGEASANDTELEQAIAVTVTGMKDGSIRADVGRELLINLFAAFRSNDHMHDVLTLTRESALPVAVAEVDRIERLRKGKHHHG
jgi:hypothetical protein